MPRKLKVYQTSLGFFDLAIAAPSMAAALRAWGASESNLFQQGFARESDDKDVIAAAMAKPGVVLRRPVGSKKRFQESAELPTAEALVAYLRQSDEPHRKASAPKKSVDEKPEGNTVSEKTDKEAKQRAAAAFEREERRRERQRQKKEAAAAKARGQRLVAIEKAKSALEIARRKHDERAAQIEKDRQSVERRAAD